MTVPGAGANGFRAPVFCGTSGDGDEGEAVEVVGATFGAPDVIGAEETGGGIEDMGGGRCCCCWKGLPVACGIMLIGRWPSEPNGLPVACGWSWPNGEPMPVICGCICGTGGGAENGIPIACGIIP